MIDASSRVQEVVQVITTTVRSWNECDLCGERVDKGLGFHDVDSVEISHESGTNFPDSGHETKTEEVDCCPSCGKKKVKPALEALGFKFHSGDASVDKEVK